MTLSRAKDGGESGPSGISAAARVRASGEDFSASFEELRQAVTGACEGHDEWEAKVVAGIQAIVGFAAASPAKARALSIEARRPDSEGHVRAHEVIDYFVGRLSELAPGERRIGISTDQGIVESIALIVRGHLHSDTAALLPDAAPDLVYLALLPYLGTVETRGWAKALALPRP